MKKLITVLLSILLIIAVCITAVAAGRRNFVDTDNNGICDNRNANCNSNFVDTDNNGVCDNRNANCNSSAKHHNAGNGNHARRNHH